MVWCISVAALLVMVVVSLAWVCNMALVVVNLAGLCISLYTHLDIESAWLLDIFKAWGLFSLAFKIL